MSNNVKDEKLSHGNGEPAVASELNPDPNAQPDAVIPGDEPEETTVKGRIEEFATRFRRPVESARDQKSGDRLRGALILVATAITVVTANEKIVYRDNFHQALIDFVEWYRVTLPADEGIQEAFIRKFDSLCQ